MNGARRCRRGVSCLCGRGLLLVTLFAAVSFPAFSADEAAALRRDIETRKAEQQRLERRLEAMEKRIARLAREARETEREVRRLRGEIDEIHRRVESARERHATQRAHLARLLRLRYLQSRGGELRLWLSFDDPAAVGRVRAYLDHLTRHLSETVAEVRDQAQRLARLEDERVALLADRERRLERLEARRRELRRIQDERRRVLAALQRETRRDEARLARLEADRKRLQGLVETLEGPAEAQGRGQTTVRRWRRASLRWPVQGRVVARYGSPRAAGGRIRWEGWLIEAPEGTPVRAVDGGVVRRAGWMRGYGNLLIIDHGRQRLSVYAFNQTLLKKEGERVAPGEIVALVGASGGRERPALYFELRQRGRPLDPARWLARR